MNIYHIPLTKVQSNNRYLEKYLDEHRFIKVVLCDGNVLVALDDMKFYNISNYKYCYKHFIFYVFSNF